MDETVDWKPISFDELQVEVSKGLDRMSPEQRLLWDAIKIPPEKWRQEPYGTDGSGFWAVALIGSIVVWFNDVEDGFNHSRYTRYGTINEYYCDQDDLDQTIRRLLRLVTTRQSSGSFGPPSPLV